MEHTTIRFNQKILYSTNVPVLVRIIFYKNIFSFKIFCTSADAPLFKTDIASVITQTFFPLTLNTITNLRL